MGSNSDRTRRKTFRNQVKLKPIEQTRSRIEVSSISYYTKVKQNNSAKHLSDLATVNLSVTTAVLEVAINASHQDPH